MNPRLSVYFLTVRNKASIGTAKIYTEKSELCLTAMVVVLSFIVHSLFGSVNAPEGSRREISCNFDKALLLSGVA